MKKVIFLIVVLFSANNLIAQDCKCPKNDLGAIKNDTIYKFPKGNSIALCGYRNEDQTFSEFVLTSCRSKRILETWGALETCKVYQKNGKLIVEELTFHPVYSDEYNPFTWKYIELSFEKKIIITKKYLNPYFPKYNEQEIAKVLNTYETSPAIIDDNCMILANKLFISAISGSLEAKKYFLEFPNKYKGIDGAFSEEYHDIELMLGVWENDQKNK